MLGTIAGASLVGIGLCFCIAGVVLATERRRPLSFVGAFLAPTGLAIAFLGAARLAWPGFFVAP